MVKTNLKKFFDKTLKIGSKTVKNTQTSVCFRLDFLMIKIFLVSIGKFG
jgi:hypothetical protein